MSGDGGSDLCYFEVVQGPRLRHDPPWSDVWASVPQTFQLPQSAPISHHHGPLQDSHRLS